MKLFGEEYENTLISANNYAIYLNKAKRFEETKSVLRKMVPVARRVLGEPHELTLSMKKVYAQMLYNDTSATLDDLREAVTRLEDAERIAQRVLGRAHPDTAEIENSLRESRAALQLRLEVCLEDMSL